MISPSRFMVTRLVTLIEAMSGLTLYERGCSGVKSYQVCTILDLLCTNCCLKTAFDGYGHDDAYGDEMSLRSSRFLWFL